MQSAAMQNKVRMQSAARRQQGKAMCCDTEQKLGEAMRGKAQHSHAKQNISKQDI